MMKIELVTTVKLTSCSPTRLFKGIRDFMENIRKAWFLGLDIMMDLFVEILLDKCYLSINGNEDFPRNFLKI